MDVPPPNTPNQPQTQGDGGKKPTSHGATAAGTPSDVVHSLEDVRSVLSGALTTQGRLGTEATPPPAPHSPDNTAANAKKVAPRRRRVWLPIALFLATCASTFLTGAADFMPTRLFREPVPPAELRRIPPWDRPIQWNAETIRRGLQYAAWVMGLLLAHELGHFVMAARHGVPASLPYFVPFPLSPFGTMGAVIAMDGRQADRRQLFDIGIAGPLAGLLVIVPLTVYGVKNAQEFGPVIPGLPHFHDPLLIKWLIQWLRPDIPPGHELTFTPALAASYIGLLVTGLNMMPVSQLDGGHVIYGLFGRWSHWIARGFVLVAIAYMAVTHVYVWAVMLVLVMLLGVSHPPTANDDVPLGPIRWTVGLLSLAIPVLCFPPRGIE